MRRAIWCTALVLVMTACGGDGGGGGDDIDLDPPDDELVVGGDLELPDWWPPGFEFPDGVEITSVGSVGDTMNLTADVPDGDYAAAHQQLVDALAANGYELLSDEDLFTVFIRDGVGRVRVRTSVEGVLAGINVDIDLWTDDQIEELRVLSAPEVTTRGSATAELDGEVVTAEGECTVQGRSRLFIADDISISASVDEFADPPNVYADVTTDDGLVYYMDIGTERSYDVSSATPPVEFTVTGVVISNDLPGEEFDLAVAVTCDS